MQFLKEIFEENKDDIKEYAGWAIFLLCLAGIVWLGDKLF